MERYIFRLLEIKNISIGQKTDINSIHKIILLLQKPAYYNFITIKTLYCLIFIQKVNIERFSL